ncbi:MAG: hypothetical protein UY04_C0061G0006 [Parcubacteria group bacterium GW2011_GWA2_47_7]|nr:MAG: hypothetical protein UY04_C0061G0006 [Parcubacteria group bacterium GW2011_GWA2_47_7]
MQTKINLLIIGAILIVAGFISLFFIEPGDKSTAVPVTGTIPSTSTDTPLSVSALSEEAVESGSAEKEFTMTAYYDATGKWFSLKEIAVKKGDTVRVKITNIKGMHDFTIDEFIVLGGSGEPLGLRSSGIYSWAYWSLTGSLLAYAFRSGESWYDISYDQGYYSLSALL